VRHYRARYGHPPAFLRMTELTVQREESIAKRRNFQPAPQDEGLDSDEDFELGTASLSETLPAMLQAVYSDNQQTQLEATTKFRKCVPGNLSCVP